MFIQNFFFLKWPENEKKHPSLLLFTTQIIQFSEFWVTMIEVIFLSFPLSCLCTPYTHVCMHKFMMSLHAKPHTSGYMNWVFSCNMTPALWVEWPGYFMCYCSDTREGEPVWPSGKALGWQAKDLGLILLRLSVLFKKVVVCGHCLVTLSVITYWNIKMALVAAHLIAGIILVVTV